MIIRQNPKCIICDKPNAKAVYDTKSRIYGDSFLYWEAIDCDCKKINTTNNNNMKKLLTILLLIISISTIGQSYKERLKQRAEKNRVEFVKEYEPPTFGYITTDDIIQYITECYNDSTYTKIPVNKWVKGDNGYYRWKEYKYVWIHKQPSSEGYKKWIENKQHLKK